MIEGHPWVVLLYISCHCFWQRCTQFGNGFKPNCLWKEKKKIQKSQREKRQWEGGVQIHRETWRSGRMERIAGRAAEWEGGMLGRKPDERLVNVTMATQKSLSLSLTHAPTISLCTWQCEVYFRTSMLFLHFLFSLSERHFVFVISLFKCRGNTVSQTSWHVTKMLAKCRI